jgi:NADPH-dependent 2,4-dienoyl-CoA reductase/sulfur reductase-like enzyme/rhodanese-related sulfurtransferase
MKLIIVGGVAGGASAATRARRLSEDAHILVIERGPDVSFANCGMPYYIGGEITDRGKMLVVTPERLKERYNLDVRTRSSVEAIDRMSKTVRIRDLNSGREYTESYDKIILAPGAAPFRPPIEGINHDRVFTLRNLQDMDRIRAAVDAGARQAVFVGGGFIGLEMVENLVRRGVKTTLIDVNEQVLPPFDREMTTPLSEELKSRGVELILSDTAMRFEPEADGLRVHLKSGKSVVGDLVVLGAGVRPENKLAVEAGLDVGPRGGIRVNASLQTSDPDIYAVGDAIETFDPILETATQIPLAGPANRQGRLAADHAFGRAAHYRGTQGTAIVRVFSRVAAITGASEKVLRRANVPYHKVYTHPANHAGYYPGAEGMSIKLLFAPRTGRILGAQAIGGDGVDKRIDVLSVAIQAEMTVFDLEEMELAYAPQFGSAKDPVNMVGFVAAGLLRGDHPQLDIAEVLASPPDQRPILVDVRTPSEFAAGAIPGAINIPVDELRERTGELPNDKPLGVYCQVGQRGYLATRILRQRGFDARNLSGGYKTFLLTR